MNNTAANVPVDLHVKGLLEMETSNNADRIPEITCDADAISVESTTLEGYGSSLSSSYSSSSLRLSNSRPYEGTPVIDRCTIIVLGFLVLGLALIWPPLLLLFAYWTSKFVSYAFRENDDAAVRRQLFAQFCQESSESLPDRFRNIDKFVLLEESYWTNERGMVLSTTIMLPRDRKQPIKGVVCYCHGYTDHVSFIKRIECQRLCEAGLAFVAIEYEGHGRSDGPLGLISDWDELIHDVASYYQQITATDIRFRNLPVFLMGESMGGAVAHDVYNRIPKIFQGVVFVCPMCKISDNMLPPKRIVDLLKWLIGPSRSSSSLLGYLPIAPCRSDLACWTHRLPEKALLSAQCPLNYGRNPRLATARELIDVTKRIGATVSEFNAPFLVLHGTQDRVTDPQLSVSLYQESLSTDKTIRLYDGMWHALLSGESDADIDCVFRDVTQWIMDRL